MFLVYKANDIAALPLKFSPAERFDSIFFIDLPSAQQRRGSWHLYISKFGEDARQARPVDGDWTCAEISGLHLPGLRFGLPVSRLSSESAGTVCRPPPL